MKSKNWVYCDECRRKTKSLNPYRNKYICYPCFRKKVLINYIPKIKSLKEALDKIYEVKNPCGYGGHIYVPRILIGRKVKLRLIK